MSSHRRTLVVLVALVVVVGAGLAAILVPRPGRPSRLDRRPLRWPARSPDPWTSGTAACCSCDASGMGRSPCCSSPAPTTLGRVDGLGDRRGTGHRGGRRLHARLRLRPTRDGPERRPAGTDDPKHAGGPAADPGGQAADLGALLAAAKIPAPYVLVGHSLGGLVVHLYAQRDPDAVAGMVFVDKLAPALERLLGDQWLPYTRLVNYPGTALEDLYTPQWEAIDATAAVATVAASPALPRVPFAVLSKDEPFEVSADFPKDLVDRFEQAWPLAQQSLVATDSDTPHTVATGSGHDVHQSAPDLTSAVIRLVLDRSRRPTSPTTIG